MEFFIVSDFPTRRPRSLANGEGGATYAYCALSHAHEVHELHDVLLGPGESILAIKHGQGELLTYVSDGEIELYHRNSIFSEDRRFAAVQTGEAYARLHPDNHAFFLVNPSPSKPALARVVEFLPMTDRELRKRVERELALARSNQAGTVPHDEDDYVEPEENKGLKLLASPDGRKVSARLSSASVYIASLGEGEVAEFRPKLGCAGLVFPLDGAVAVDGGAWSGRPPYFVKENQAVVLAGMTDRNEVIIFERMEASKPAMPISLGLQENRLSLC